jgi:hypothetical protein
LTRVVTLAAAAPLGHHKPNSSILVGEGVREGFAEPFVIPLPGTKPRFAVKTHLFVAGLLVRAARPAICEGDPVVYTMEPQFSPCETRAKTYRLGRDASPEEIVPPDEDPALAVAAHPVDVEVAAESDGLFLVRDGPLDRRGVFSRLLEARLRSLVGHLGEARSPESADLGLQHPHAAQLVVILFRLYERDAATTFETWPVHQRVASAARGAYSRSLAPQRSFHGSLLKNSCINVSYKHLTLPKTIRE